MKIIIWLGIGSFVIGCGLHAAAIIAAIVAANAPETFKRWGGLFMGLRRLGGRREGMRFSVTATPTHQLYLTPK